MTKTRITIDIDSYTMNWKLRALRAYHEMQYLGAEVEVRISSSGKGIHLIGWFDEGFTADEKAEMRRQFGDDPNRMRLDHIRGAHGSTTGVLWSEKGSGSADRDFGSLSDALAHIEATTRTDYDRVKDRVTRGKHV